MTRLSYGWIVVLGTFAAGALAALPTFSFAVLLKPLASDFEWSRGVMSFTYTIVMVATGSSSIVWGYLADRHSIRAIIFVGGTVLSLGVAMASLTASIWHLYLFLGLMAGLGRGALITAPIPLVTRWFTRKVGLAVGVTVAGVSAGGLVFPSLTDYLVFNFDWRESLTLLGVVGLLSVGAATALIRNPPIKGAERNPIHSRESLKWSRREILASRSFWNLGLIHFFCCICHSVVLVHVVAYMTDIGFPGATAALALGLIGASSIVGRIGMGSIADRVGGRNALTASALIQAVLILWLIWPGDAASFYAFSVIFGVGYGGVVSLNPVVGVEFFGVRSLGTAYGVIAFMATLGMGLGGYLGGFIFDLFETYFLAWVLSLAAGFATAILAATMKNPNVTEGREGRRRPSLTGPGWQDAQKGRASSEGS